MDSSLLYLLSVLSLITLLIPNQDVVEDTSPTTEKQEILLTTAKKTNELHNTSEMVEKLSIKVEKLQSIIMSKLANYS